MRLRNIWRLAATLLLAAALPAAAEVTQQVEVSALAMAHDQFTINPADRHVAQSVVIDAAPFVTVAVTSPSKTLSVALIAPNGTTYHVGDPDTAAFESSITPDPLSPTSKGANYLANLYSPAAGTWTLDIRETASITAPVDGIYMLLFDNDTRAVMLGGGTYLAGDKARLYVAAFDGQTRIHPLTINASEIHAEGAVGVPVPVTFHDDGMVGDAVAGDGLYTATVPADAAGAFQVSAVIDGQTGSGPFRRTVSTTLRVAPRRATLHGTFADSAVDTDGDGFTDAVQIRPGGTVNVGGSFITTVRLTASNGKVMQRSATATLTAGAAIAPVNFPAPEMESELVVDGPYSVDVVTVEFINPDSVDLAARYVSLGSTQAYRLADFHHEPLRLTGTNTATGVDTNGNLKFDSLHVTLGIYAQNTGWYNYSVSLHDSGGKELGFVSSWVYLNAGNNDVAFDFSGWTIGQNGVNGPYSVDGLLMYGSYYGMGSLSVDHVFATPPFKASQFEGFKGDTTPPVLSVSVSPQILYPPNHKMIEITPAISVSDDIDLNPTVQLLSIVSNEGQNVRGDGNTDTDIYIDPNGKLFVRSERSGLGTDRVYTFTWSARDASGNTSTATATVTVPHDQSKK